MTDYNGGQRPGSKIHIEGVDYLDECTKAETEYGNLHFKWPVESAFYNAGWRCYLIGGENGHLHWLKIGHKRVHYNVYRVGSFYRDDEIIVDEYKTALRSKNDVYYIFYNASESEALKQLAFWQFQFQPVKVLSKYKPLFLGCGIFFAAALWGKIHG